MYGSVKYSFVSNDVTPFSVLLQDTNVDVYELNTVLTRYDASVRDSTRDSNYT